jgi:hypothetical protein
MGSEFNWGDREVIRCALRQLRGKKVFVGNQSDWIAIDTNHHVTWVGQEVEELVMRMARIKG